MGGSEAEVLPIERCVQLVVAYANLKSLGIEELSHLASVVLDSKPSPEIAELLRKADAGRLNLPKTPRASWGWTIEHPGSYPHAYMIRAAARERNQSWIRGLVARAADGKALRREDERELADMLLDREAVLDVSYQAGQIASRIKYPDDLMWFMAAGVLSLFADPYRGKCRRCANFEGSNYAKLPSVACGNFMLTIRERGRPAERFCSPACRRRVNDRERGRG